MNNKRSYRALALLAMALVVLAGCSPVKAMSINTYFGGSVVVEYNQMRHSDDYLKFTFFDKGDYNVSFDYTPGLQTATTLPYAFTQTVDGTTRVKIVTQRYLPAYLRVTIEREGVTEFHDFKWPRF